MKRRYYLHRENAPLQSDSVIYSVWVGESAREQKYLSQLKEWAFSKGATLILWSEDVDYYIDYESKGVFSGHGLLDFGFVRADLTAADALKHAKICTKKPSQCQKPFSIKFLPPSHRVSMARHEKSNLRQCYPRDVKT